MKSYWFASASFDTTTLDDINAESEIDNSADLTNGFSGTWLCDDVTFPSTSTENVTCYKYQPQFADTYTSDYRFAPSSESDSFTAPNY